MDDTSHPQFSYSSTIQLPGTLGGHGDWVAFDPATQTIWIAQSPDNSVVVLDARTDTVKATISGISGGNGIAVTPNDVFVADPVHNVVDVIDKHSYQIVAQVAATGTNLDGIVYAPNTGQVYVASDNNNVLDAISTQNGFSQTASYTLTPSSTGPDVPMYAKGMVYVPDGQVVDAVNPATGAIENAPTLVGSGAVKPGVYDPVTNRFVFGSTINQLEVVSGNGAGGIGNVVGTIATGNSTDQGAIDVKARLAFFGSGSGAVDVVNLDTMKVVATLPAETGMHTLNVDPRTHSLYVYEDTNNVVDVWHYTNAGDFRMSFAGAMDQLAASIGNGGSLAASFSDLLQSAGSSSASSMFPDQVSVGQGNGQGNGPLADQVPHLSSFLTDLNQGHAASAVAAIFGHGS